MKITKKLANGDVLQLPGLKMTLGTPETDIEDEIVDTPMEEEEVMIEEEEEGDGTTHNSRTLLTIVTDCGRAL